MAASLGPWGIAVTAAAALITFLELRLKLFSKTIEAVGKAWNAFFSQTGTANIKMNDALTRAREGKLYMKGGRFDPNVQAQRQASGSTSTTNKSLVNTNTFNFNGMPSNTQAKSLGRSFSGGMMNGFQALGGY